MVNRDCRINCPVVVKLNEPRYETTKQWYSVIAPQVAYI